MRRADHREQMLEAYSHGPGLPGEPEWPEDPSVFRVRYADGERRLMENVTAEIASRTRNQRS